MHEVIAKSLNDMEAHIRTHITDPEIIPVLLAIQEEFRKVSENFTEAWGLAYYLETINDTPAGEEYHPFESILQSHDVDVVYQQYTCRVHTPIALIVLVVKIATLLKSISWDCIEHRE